MDLQQHGTSTLTSNEITGISNLGFWLLVNDSEYFVPFKDYPQFKKCTIEQIFSFEMLSPNQFYWKSVDCDIELEALKSPERFPLIFK
jgi:hypothetical protein